MKIKCKLVLRASNGHNAVFSYYLLLIFWGCAYGCYIQKYNMQKRR